VLNLPLDARADRSAFRTCVTKALQAISNFNPDFIFLSAGFDAHKDDPLGGDGNAGLHLIEEDYTWMTSKIVEVAAAVCQGRVVSVLEGGYDPAVLRRCVHAHILSLMNGS